MRMKTLACQKIRTLKSNQREENHMSEHTSEELRAQVGELNTYILDNKAKVDSGEVVKIDGLDTRVTELCERIQSLPDDEHASFHHDLEGMISNLDSLMTSLNKMQADIQIQMEQAKDGVTPSIQIDASEIDEE